MEGSLTGRVRVQLSNLRQESTHLVPVRSLGGSQTQGRIRLAEKHGSN